LSFVRACCLSLKIGCKQNASGACLFIVFFADANIVSTTDFLDLYH
jgi:hypothetical protein